MWVQGRAVMVIAYLCDTAAVSAACVDAYGSDHGETVVADSIAASANRLG